MEDIAGRTAFVTGGAQGIGLGIARALARAGARLALADVDTAALEAARQELGALTAVGTYRLDVRDRDSFARVADSATSSTPPPPRVWRTSPNAVPATPTTRRSSPSSV